MQQTVGWLEYSKEEKTKDESASIVIFDIENSLVDTSRKMRYYFLCLTARGSAW